MWREGEGVKALTTFANTFAPLRWSKKASAVEGRDGPTKRIRSGGGKALQELRTVNGSHDSGLM